MRWIWIAVVCLACFGLGYAISTIVSTIPIENKCNEFIDQHCICSDVKPSTPGRFPLLLLNITYGGYNGIHN